MSETRTIKIRTTTYRLLKIMAAENGEKLIDLVDRLARNDRDNVAHSGTYPTQADPPPRPDAE